MSGAVSPDSLRSQRKNPSVLKSELARLRERDRCALVIVIEGKEDLPVYEVWFNRLFEGLEWEPVIASGKRNALAFRELLRRDTTGMAICTYFIFDHDYDGLAGAAGDIDAYVLPAYSVENVLVEDIVFDSFLRTELRVIGDPEERARLVELYRSARTEFLGVIASTMELMYGARNEKVGNVVLAELPVVVEANGGDLRIQAGIDLSGLVRTEHPVSEGGIAEAKAFFASKDKGEWVRGKYAYDFFKQVCRILFDDLRAETPKIFRKLSTDRSVSPASLDYRNLASKSRIPLGLRETLDGWIHRCGVDCVT